VDRDAAGGRLNPPLDAAPAGGFARRRIALWLAPGAGLGLLLVTVLLGFVVAITGADLGCLGGGGGGAAQQAVGPGPPGPAPSRSARAAIPAARLAIYQRAGRRFSIDWAFLASIGAQECNHGACAGPNSSGCAGPMQIAYVHGSACSPGVGPTEWDRFKTDGNGDGRADVNNPADAVFTAARLLRSDKHAPPTGGSYAAYRQAACNYYGACADASANYADQVMARAVQYGFKGGGAPAPTNPAQAQPAPAPTDLGVAAACANNTQVAGPVSLARGARRLFAPRRLAPLPVGVVAGGGRIECDARVAPDVAYLARRYRQKVTACYAIHSPGGEHPLGAAADLVPATGNWSTTMRLARALGWRPTCAASGVRPACAHPPFRFIGYNGYPNHGDPQHCVPCAGGPHLHVSWLTSASIGEPQNAARSTYFAASWIEVLANRGHHA
jgi:hypothetical protein